MPKLNILRKNKVPGKRNQQVILLATYPKMLSCTASLQTGSWSLHTIKAQSRFLMAGSSNTPFLESVWRFLPCVGMALKVILWGWVRICPGFFVWVGNISLYLIIGFAGFNIIVSTLLQQASSLKCSHVPEAAHLILAGFAQLSIPLREINLLLHSLLSVVLLD